MHLFIISIIPIYYGKFHTFHYQSICIHTSLTYTLAHTHIIKFIPQRQIIHNSTLVYTYDEKSTQKFTPTNFNMIHIESHFLLTQLLYFVAYSIRVLYEYVQHNFPNENPIYRNCTQKSKV